MTFHPDSLPDLGGKIFIVTGGNNGLGYYTCLHLAEHNARIYMCSRSSSKAAAAIEKIKAIVPSADITPLIIDHMSLASVNEAADHFLSIETQLHVLVNNAGVMKVPYAVSGDGYETEWQTNYLAHWLLTKRLLPLMLTTSKSLPAGTVRIVNLTSGGHFMAPRDGINFSDTNLANLGFINTRYGQSKLANILHAKTLNKHYGPDSESSKAGNGTIWTCSVHPGPVESGLAEKAENFTTMYRMLKLVGSYYETDMGSWTQVFCAASPDFKKKDSGEYFVRIAKSGGMTSGKAKDKKLADKLEAFTEEQMIKGGWIGKA